jgi:ankyrin repeat protein
VNPIAAAALLFVFSAVIPAAGPPLVDAARRGDVAQVRTLLTRKADVNAAGPDSMTALHWAVQREDLPMVDDLLHARANANAVTRYGVTPIYIASMTGNAAVAEKLLKAGADANTVMPDGETALMTAARTGMAEVVRVLLAHGANLRVREPSRGQTALMWAAAENNAAAVNAHYELAGFLLDRGANPNGDAQGWTALHQIAWSRRHNAGFNLPGPVATGSLDSLDLVRKLVRLGANVNARQTKEPRDGNRNQQNRIGATPFLLAAKSADVPLMRVLLETGADPSVKTANNTTPLMVAAGVGIWAPGENPGTPEEALAAVRLLLDLGADVNAIDDNGDTAMHGAVYRGGNVSVIQALADKGARLDVINKKGWMPVTAADGVEYTPAVLKRYPEAAALLRRLMRERGLPVPESTQPGDSTAQN